MNPLNGSVSDPLAGLKDIHLPDAPGWWPPAPGWWLLALLLVALVIFLVSRVHRWWRRSQPRRAFERELAELPLEGDPRSLSHAVGTLSRLVRRFAVTEFGRDHVAALTGEHWLRFLDRTSGTHDFTSGPGKILASGPYQRGHLALDTADLAALKAVVRHWARNCRRRDRAGS